MVKIVKPEARKVRSEEAYEILRDSILAGVYKPETKLKFEILQADLGLSASPVREALTKLTTEGLVVSAERKGFSVAPISLSEFMDITRIRKVMEPMALCDSIDNGDEEWEAYIIRSFHFLTKERDEKNTQPLAYNSKWVKWHREFHRALNAACPSQKLLHITENLFNQTERYRFFSASRRKTPRKTHDEHQQIMNAVLDRDKEAACKLLDIHFNKTAENLQIVFNENEENTP